MRTLFFAAAFVAVAGLSACGGSRKESAAAPEAAATTNDAVAANPEQQKTLGEKAIDKVKDCAAQKLKMKACDQLKWPASTVCRHAADKGACLGL